MAKTMTIRGVEGGYGAALDRALEGSVYDQAIFEPFALPLLVDGLLNEMGIEDPFHKMVHNGLVRQAKFVGPGEHGWIITIGGILAAYDQVWGEVTAQSGIQVFIELENHGFRYEDYLDSVLCLKLIKEGVKSEPRLAEDKDLRKIIDFNRPSVSDDDDFHFRTFSVFLHHVARCAGWTCNAKRTSRRPPSPLSEPWVPAVVILHGLRNMNTVNCGRCQDLHFTETWNKAMCGHRMGLTWPSVYWIMQQPASGKSIVDFLRLAHSKGFSQELLIEVKSLGQSTLKGRSLLSLVDAACVWNQMKQPGTLKGFLEIGGTRGAYEAHKQAREEEERKRKLAEQAESEARLAASAPKGRKRGQPGHVEDEPAAIDFEAMCAELDVATHFAALDQDTTRVVLVHGLLREGDRLASFTGLPERNEKKLWSQCRSHLGENPSRRAFKKVLGAMVSEHLVSCSGGKHRLATGSVRYPEAQELIRALRALVSRFSS